MQLWEYVLNQHPDLQSIVEIGTWEGGMSRFLHAQATQRGMGFTTLDVTRPEIPAPGFVPIDVFEQADEVRDWIEYPEHKPLILLCDGGDKPREMREFAPSLSENDILAVHDWNDEAKPEDVPDCLEEAYGGFCDAIQSKTRFFFPKPSA